MYVILLVLVEKANLVVAGIKLQFVICHLCILIDINIDADEVEEWKVVQK